MDNIITQEHIDAYCLSLLTDERCIPLGIRLQMSSLMDLLQK